MKIFLDTANLESIKKFNDMGLLDGITTNPSLMSKEGGNPKDAMEEITKIIQGDVSLEVVSTDYSGMLEEGKRLREYGDNVVVKVPMTPDGLKACKSFSSQGIPVNVTLIFSANQALLAAKSGAKYVSPFIGRLDDIGQDGMNLIKEIKEIFSNYTFETQILVASVRHPLHVIDAAKIGADVVLECTGFFLDKASAGKHIEAGAKKVIISAPAKEVDFTVVQGVNSKELKKEHNIISNGSCTTNCLAPVAMVLENSFGIEYGYMTTIHSYTGDQKLLDTLHKDLRRARASGDAMIPTSTGAAKAMSLVLPSLKGKLDGTAIRVPTPNVSLIDLTFVPKKEVTAENINDAMSKAANGPLKGILATNSAPLVSKDFNHNPHSSIFDLTQTQVIKGKFSRVLSWYDNEWGFSNRMCDTAIQIAGLI